MSLGQVIVVGSCVIGILFTLTVWLIAERQEADSIAIGHGDVWEPEGQAATVYANAAAMMPIRSTGRTTGRDGNVEVDAIAWPDGTFTLELRMIGLREALEWAMAPNPRYQGRHRTEPRCSVFMPTDATCDCGYVEARAALDADDR